MSYQPLNPNTWLGQWKVMDHPDRKASSVTTRKLTPEEFEHYNQITKSFKDKLKEEMNMLANVKTEELIEICKEHGLGSEAQEIIMDRYGLNKKQSEKIIWNRKIKQLLQEEQKTIDCAEHGSDCKVTQHNGYEEHSLGLPDKDEFEAQKGIAIDFLNFDAAEPNQAKPRLRPKILSSQIFPYEYELYDEVLTIHAIGASLTIDWPNLDDFIKDLIEVKRIAEA